jgi:hypothetical protein
MVFLGFRGETDASLFSANVHRYGRVGYGWWRGWIYQPQCMGEMRQIDNPDIVACSVRRGIGPSVLAEMVCACVSS